MLAVYKYNVSKTLRNEKKTSMEKEKIYNIMFGFLFAHL